VALAAAVHCRNAEPLEFNGNLSRDQRDISAPEPVSGGSECAAFLETLQHYRSEGKYSFMPLS
jgi:hypothetical protein